MGGLSICILIMVYRYVMLKQLWILSKADSCFGSKDAVGRASFSIDFDPSKSWV